MVAADLPEGKVVRQMLGEVLIQGSNMAECHPVGFQW